MLYIQIQINYRWLDWKFDEEQNIYTVQNAFSQYTYYLQKRKGKWKSLRDTSRIKWSIRTGLQGLFPISPKSSLLTSPQSDPSTTGQVLLAGSWVGSTCPSRSWSGRMEWALSPVSQLLPFWNLPVTQGLWVTSSLIQGTCKQWLFEKGPCVFLCTQDLWE